MRFFGAFEIFGLYVLCVFHVSAAVDFSKWAPPGPGDVRSPCPGLNSLANHGLIPRNGKGMTIPILIQGLRSGLNVGADFAVAIGGAGMLSSSNLLGASFDLDNLNKHNFPIEHDASLSRGDAYFGNDHTFNQSIFDTVLAYFAGEDNVTVPSAARARLNRVAIEKARDPAFFYSAKELVLSYGETSLYLSTMGDPITGIAPLEYVKILFEEERLPYKEGWRPPTTETTLPTLLSLIVKLIAAGGEPLPKGLDISLPAITLAFEGSDPISGI